MQHLQVTASDNHTQRWLCSVPARPCEAAQQQQRLGQWLAVQHLQVYAVTSCTPAAVLTYCTLVKAAYRHLRAFGHLQQAKQGQSK